MSQRYIRGDKDYICLDEDGYFNTPDGRLWGSHINDPARIRRARLHKWIDKHPDIVQNVARGIIASGIIGLMVLFIMYPRPTFIAEPDPIDQIENKINETHLSQSHKDEINQMLEGLRPGEEDPPDYDDPYQDHP